MLNEPIFDKMKNKSLWTMSSVTTKMPLDLQWFIAHQNQPDCIKGAKYQDHRSLGTYEELQNAIPGHGNATYYYNMNDEDYILLDIEPKCPEHIRNHLLQLPYVYGERSMSGKGYHLLLPKTKNIKDYPDALLKVQLQEEHGYYEILVNHYATFTGDSIPLPKKVHDFSETLYKSLAEKAIASKSIELMDSELTDIDDIPYSSEIIELTLRKPFEKTPEDYNEVDDYGRIKKGNKFEFGMMSYYAHRIYQRSNLDMFKHHSYTDQELLSLLYHIIQEELEPRPKHNEIRHDSNGKPISFLLWRCNTAMSQVIDYYKNQHPPKKKSKHK